MKNLSKVFFALSVFLIIGSCTSQRTSIAQNSNQIITGEKFTFVAQEAFINATKYRTEEIRESGNSWENPPNFRERQDFGSSRTSSLSAGYRITIDKNNLEVILPYYGEMGKKWITNPSGDGSIRYMTSDSGVVHFTTSDFTINEKMSKKGKTTLTIVANDSHNPIKIKMDVFDNGKTIVALDTGIRKSTSFGGYITNNTIAKK